MQHVLYAAPKRKQKTKKPYFQGQGALKSPPQKITRSKKAPFGAFFDSIYFPCSKGRPASRAARVPPIKITYSRELSKPSNNSAARGALLPPPHKM